MFPFNFPLEIKLSVNKLLYWANHAGLWPRGYKGINTHYLVNRLEHDSGSFFFKKEIKKKFKTSWKIWWIFRFFIFFKWYFYGHGIHVYKGSYYFEPREVQYLSQQVATYTCCALRGYKSVWTKGKLPAAGGKVGTRTQRSAHQVESENGSEVPAVREILGILKVSSEY